MENKINVAELLKDCPSGMELDCTMYDNLYFDSLNADYYGTINCYTLIDGFKRYIKFTKYGTFNNNIGAKCVIFPKGKTTWEGFQIPFKDGDVVSISKSPKDTWIGIFKQYNKTSFESHCSLSTIGDFCSEGFKNHTLIGLRLATEEEKQKLFDAIKDNGYKWNPETKTLEKLIESNEDVTNKDVNDKIVMSGIYFDREYYADEVELHLNNYEIEIRNGKTYAIFKNKETKIPKPKFNIGDRIKEKESDYISGVITNIDPDYFYKVEYEEGGVSYINIKFQDKWELVPNKFDITTLKPFDKVLYRQNDRDTWISHLYSNYTKNINTHILLGCVVAKQCVPYEGNEHLLGTTNDCDEFYKTW